MNVYEDNVESIHPSGLVVNTLLFKRLKRKQEEFFKITWSHTCGGGETIYITKKGHLKVLHVTSSVACQFTTVPNRDQQSYEKIHDLLRHGIDFKAGYALIDFTSLTYFYFFVALDMHTF